MRVWKLSNLSYLLGTAAVLALPGTAMAQTASDTESDPNEIIVNATRDSRDLQQVPMTVDVATGEDLQKLKIFDVKDISQLAPGLELTNNGGRNNTTSLRGQSFDPDQGTAPAVQVYFNEIPADAQTVYTAIYDISQIEVLRGPQGQLRGQTAPAGAILIGTRRPSFDAVEGYAQGTVTDRDGYNIQGGVSIPLSPQFAIRFAGTADGNRINHVRNITRGGEYSRSRTESGRITLGFKPSDTFTAYLTYQYTNARNNQFTQVVGAGNTPQTVYREVFATPSIFIPPGIGGGPFAVNTTLRSGPALTAADYAAVSDGVYQVDNKTHLWNLAFDWDLDFATLSFVGAHQRSRIITHRDEDVGNALVGIVDNSFVDVTYPVDTQELRLTSNGNEGFGWGLGVYHSNQKGRALNNIDSDLFVYNVAPTSLVQAPLGPGGSFITVPNRLPLAVEVVVPIDVETTSFNANARYSSGGLRIEGGIRYSIVRKTQTTQLKTAGFVNSGPTEIIPAALQDTSLNLWSGGASVSYDFSEDTTLYFAYGNSFRVPTTGVSTPGGITADLVRTGTERTNSFELGLKGKLLDRKLNYSIAAFYQQFDGYLSRFDGIFWRTNPAFNGGSGSGFFSFNYNGDAKIKGVEAQLSGQLTPNWDLNVSASYAHGRYDNARLPCNDFAGTGIPNQNGIPVVQGYNAGTNSPNVSYCTSNGRLAEVPDFSMSLNTEVRFPVGNLTPFVSALFTHRPGFFSEQRNFTYESRELLNMFAGVRGKDNRWEVSAFVRNLFNQKRITNISLGTGQYASLLAANGGGVYDSGYRTVNTTTPREFGFTAGFKF